MANSRISRVAFSVDEVAQMLAISPWTVRKLVNEGELERLAIIDKVLITAASFRKLVRKGRGKG